jgi:hypothetical protein
MEQRMKKSKKKQGDPQRSPRSPWGLPKPARKPGSGRPKNPKPLNSDKLMQQKTLLGNRFLLRPLPQGMLSLLEEIRQRPFPGHRQPANIGQESPRKPKQRLLNGKGTLPEGFSRLPGINASLMNITRR